MKKNLNVAFIKFSVANFGCFRERVDFHMSTRKDAQNNFNLKKTEDYLLKSTIIYGPNASGKSTLLRAMKFVDLKIRKSTNTEVTEKLKASPFLMEEGFEKKPSFFEIIFSINEKIYRYNFSIFADNTIDKENFFDLSGTTEKVLFSREKQSIEVDSNFINDEALKDRTSKSYLFLSVVSQWNEEVDEKIVYFFKKGFSVINGDSLARHIPSTAETAIKNNDFKEKVIDYLRRADFCITDFEIKKEKIPEELKQLLKKNKSIEISDPFIRTVLFSHLKYNKKKEVLNTVKLLPDDESDGTLHFFGGLYPIINALTNGTILIIDELNKHLHPNLCKFIVNLFHSKETNPYNAQLIFTTHDVTLLAEKDIDRDQFWFTQRDKYGVASLFSLAEFKERKGSDFQTRYLSGRYGALPFINNSFSEQ
ncbi:ATP-binding protein [Candidatus Gracilibacteria bacterium]|nr:ATP-binding protein [Candidatus Gracilibacteria bacterium]